jgi:hypothetical protein
MLNYLLLFSKTGLKWGLENTKGGWLWLIMFNGYSTYFTITFPVFSNPVTCTLMISPILFLLSLKFLMLSSSLMMPETPRFRLQKMILFYIFLINAKM